ncbi:MAG: hypothetical protein IT577_23720 [Verrucomicrobiae bacterium]|nr:hypothetical protein [Verrucomicrobiae bacterium]
MKGNDTLARAVALNRADLNPAAAIAGLAPGSREVAGIRLRPVTMAVHLLLEKAGNPLAVGGREPTTLDVMTAAWAMSHPTTEVLTALEDGHHDRKVILWAESLTPRAAQELALAIREMMREAFATALSVGDAEADPDAADPKAPGPSPATSSAGP